MTAAKPPERHPGHLPAVSTETPRPIEVGETVRIVRVVNDVAPEYVGKIGTVDMIDRTSCPYRVRLETGPVWCHEVERIPRPAAAQATVPVFPAGADRTQPCPACSRSWGEHYGIACHGGDGGKCCPACGDRFSDHYYEGLCHGPVPTPPPTSNIYADGLDLGGLTPIRCWMHWRDNHADLEHGSAPRWPMTDDQITSAKRIWNRFGPSSNHSSVLRAKIAASTAADKARTPSVVVELQDEP